MTEFMEFLRRPAVLEEELQTLRTRLHGDLYSSQGLVANYSGMGGGGQGGSHDGVLAAIADLSDQEMRLRAQLLDAEHELDKFLRFLKYRIPDHYCRLLRYRYLMRLQWGFVMTALQEKGHTIRTLRTVYNWHRAAVAEAYTYWKETQDESRLHADSGL